MDKAANILKNDLANKRDLTAARSRKKVIAGRFVGEESYAVGVFHRYVEWLINGDARIMDVFATRSGCEVAQTVTGIGKTLRVKLPVLYATWADQRPLEHALSTSSPRYDFVRETIAVAERATQALADKCVITEDEYGKWYHFDKVDEQHAFSQLEVGLRAFLSESIPPGLKSFPFAVCLGPTGAGNKPALFGPKISLRTDGLAGTVMPPKQTAEPDYRWFRAEKNLDFIMRLWIEWYMTPIELVDGKPRRRGGAQTTLSVFDVMMVELGMRLLGSPGIDALPYKLHTQLECNTASGSPLGPEDVARTMVFQYIMRGIFAEQQYADHIDPLKDIDIEMDYSLRNNELLQNQEYVDQHFRGDAAQALPGSQTMNWLRLEGAQGTGSSLCALRFLGHENNGLYKSLFAEQKTGKLVYQNEVHGFDIGDATETIGSTIIAPKDMQHQWYKLEGAVRAGLLSYSRTSVYDQIPSQDIMVVPKLSPYPRYPRTPAGMVQAIFAGNEGVLGGDELFIAAAYEEDDSGDWVSDSSILGKGHLYLDNRVEGFGTAAEPKKKV